MVLFSDIVVIIAIIITATITVIEISIIDIIFSNSSNDSSINIIVIVTISSSICSNNISKGIIFSNGDSSINNIISSCNRGISGYSRVSINIPISTTVDFKGRDYFI